MKQAEDISQLLLPNFERGAHSRLYTSSRPRISYRQQQHLDNFNDAATAYCQFLNSIVTSPNQRLISVMHTLYIILMDLQQAVVRLPDLSSKNYKMPPGSFKKASNCHAVQLQRLFGDWDRYSDPIDHRKWVKGSYRYISCDLGDIYDDLHEGLQLWDLGSSWDHLDAAVFWRDMYEIHWMAHLRAALYQISTLLPQIRNQEN